MVCCVSPALMGFAHESDDCVGAFLCSVEMLF